jgi:hypothetical protein
VQVKKTQFVFQLREGAKYRTNFSLRIKFSDTTPVI